MHQTKLKKISVYVYTHNEDSEFKAERLSFILGGRELSSSSSLQSGSEVRRVCYPSVAEGDFLILHFPYLRIQFILSAK
jgi:hypothetical protein